MSNLKKYLSSTLWMVTGRLLKSMLGFLVGIFVARYLGADRYGVLMYSLGVVSLFSFISSLGMDSILVRELVRDRQNENSLLATSLVLRVGASLLSVVCVLLLLYFTRADRETSLLTLMCCSMYFFWAGEGLRAYFEANVEGRNIVIAEMLQSVICSLLRIYFIAVHADVFMFCLCCLLEPLLIVFLFGIIYRRKNKKFKGWQVSGTVAKQLLRAGLPLVLSGLAITIYSQIDKIMLKNMLGENGNEQVGLYTVALRIIPFVTLIPHMLSKSLFPAISKDKGVTQEEIDRRFQLYLDLMTWVGIGLSSCLFLLAKPIIVLYGREFIASVIILQIVCWKGVFFCTSLSSGNVFIAQNIHQYAVLRNLAGSVVNVAMNYYLIPQYQAVGAAVATVASLFVSSFLIHIFMPVYQPMFWRQMSSLIKGPVRLFTQLKVIVGK